MCVLGTDDNVKEFNCDITIDELRGYKNQFTISNKDVSKANYTVFDTKYKNLMCHRCGHKKKKKKKKNI